LVTRVLVAEPDLTLGLTIQRACGDLARVAHCRDFQAAREELIDFPDFPVDALITNLRLHDYNGLHLVLLAREENQSARCVVHSDRPDPYLIREAQAIGAFFERTDRLPDALMGYLNAVLPERDRRDPARLDRRVVFRGGRRSADRPAHV
jgi:DNA-binding NarL/FixJ family response regulator